MEQSGQTFQDKCADLLVVIHSDHSERDSDMMESNYKHFL